MIPHKVLNIRGYICTYLALFFIFVFIRLLEYQILQFHASISEARPFPLEWQSCHALSYIVKPRIHTVFRPIEIVALPFPVYRFTLVMKFYH